MAWTLSCLMMLAFAACSEDDLSTNQFQGGVHLNVFGPSPVMRGGSVHFYGSNLDKIKQVNIPGMGAVTNFDIVKSGVPSEIVVKLDKDTPEPGYVTLITNTDDEIKTTTLLTYVEGIEFDEAAPMTPASIQPGDVLTIKGDYLNLVKEVIFAENVFVTEFEAQSRYELKVRVPEEARTGKIILSDGAEIPNWIYSASALVVGTPVVSKVASPRGEAALQGTVTAKLGETITVTGDFMSLVAGIKTGDADSELGTFYFEDFEVSADGKSLSFALPAEAVDGDVNLICRSGVEIPACKLVTVAPTNVVVNGNQPAKNGQTMTIAGNDLDVVVSVSFPNVDIPVEVQATANEISVVVPELAQEGEIVLNMANRKTVTAPYTLVKPTATEYSANPASAGSMLQITGTNLDLVATVQFTGAENAAACEVNEDGTVLNVTVPMDAESGAIVLNLKNGSEVTISDINIVEAKFCYVVEFPGEDVELRAGQTFTLVVNNSDKLTDVQINGESCQYIAQEKNLIIAIPDNAKKGAKLRLVSSNGEITYTIDFVPRTEITTVIWTGLHSAGGWVKGFGDLSWGGYDWSKVTPGTELVINFAVDPAKEYNCQIRFGNGSWAALPGTIELEGSDKEGNIAMADDAKEYRLVLTQDMIDELNKNGGLVICGAWFILNKVSLVEHISVEETLWKGEVVADDWKDQPGMLSDGGAEFKEFGAKVGSIVRFYITPMEAGWNLQVVEGHWTGVKYCDLNQDNWNLAEHNGAVEIVLTQEILDAAYKVGGWGNVFLLNGDNVICTKVTIE